ncbi:hypothetical protein vBSlqSZDD2_55 [Serratia phage vB_SlqS_ZDD2]|nr:hypothetical protein vBSlqSZDD2_55 [Serratia phage vB_SlqS_ZDD2]
MCNESQKSAIMRNEIWDCLDYHERELKKRHFIVDLYRGMTREDWYKQWAAFRAMRHCMPGYKGMVKKRGGGYKFANANQLAHDMVYNAAAFSFPLQDYCYGMKQRCEGSFFGSECRTIADFIQHAGKMMDSSSRKYYIQSFIADRVKATRFYFD